ncbi:MAG: diaminopimelate decarboxylase [Deltaproteobacteria bacterium]|nr:diaminopimelate decarboxylase [Deltaproteobacteria bacterium]
MNHFNYKDRELYCENISVKEIASKVKTPFYLYSSATLTRHFNAFDRAFSRHPHLICFAVKANSNLAVLNLLGKLGAGADIVSGGELHRALKAGIPADRIVYSGVGKTEKEIREATKADILMFNVESMEELDAISRQAQRLKCRVRVSFRKFGLPMFQALEAYKVASERDELDVVGIDCHIGSQLIKVEPFVDAIKKIKSLLQELEGLGTRLKFIDVGGGLGIRYRDEIPPELDAYARALLSEVKDLSHCLFYIVDAAMNDLARPALYEAYHEILPVIKTDTHLHPVDVVGPICETGDFLARERPMPDLNQGSLLAVMSTGAYGFTMSSNYNSRPRVSEVMVKDDHFKVIRKRETYASLLRGETIW